MTGVSLHTAAGASMPALDAGLAHVQTVQGVLVLDPPFHVTKLVVNHPVPAGAFTVTSDYRLLAHAPGVPLVVTVAAIADAVSYAGSE